MESKVFVSSSDSSDVGYNSSFFKVRATGDESICGTCLAGVVYDGTPVPLEGVKDFLVPGLSVSETDDGNKPTDLCSFSLFPASVRTGGGPFLLG